jgi:hypothetical protein
MIKRLHRSPTNSSARAIEQFSPSYVLPNMATNLVRPLA